jgi:hypothetical protein
MTTDDTNSVTRALYATISGVAGAPRNWALHDSLFAPGAHSYVLHPDTDGTRQAEVLTMEQYRSTRQAFFDSSDFYEIEKGHHATVRGDIALVYSEYDARYAPDGPAFETGVNALMMIRLAGGWRITSIAWNAGGIAARIRGESYW